MPHMPPHPCPPPTVCQRQTYTHHVHCTNTVHAATCTNTVHTACANIDASLSAYPLIMFTPWCAHYTLGPLTLCACCTAGLQHLHHLPHHRCQAVQQPVHNRCRRGFRKGGQWEWRGRGLGSRVGEFLWGVCGLVCALVRGHWSGIWHCMDNVNDCTMQT